VVEQGQGSAKRPSSF